MAGHSKWANIKHRKDRQDAKRGKIFTKYIREHYKGSVESPRFQRFFCNADTNLLGAVCYSKV